MADNATEVVTSIDGWIIEKKLGAGTYGTVYKVYKEDQDERKYYALKHISIPKSESDVENLRREMDEEGVREYYADLAARFENEIAAMDKLSGCKNVVHLEDAKVVKNEEEIKYDIIIVMELLTDSQEYIKSHWSEEEVVRLGKDVCKALIACNEEGIIHRDIKPANILAEIKDNEATYKLADFGIAKQLSTATFSMTGRMGTSGYMAYEEHIGSGYGDVRTIDICSLGLVLYQLLNSNRLPFLPTTGKYTPDQYEIAVKKRMSGQPLPMPCNASVGLGNVILKACAFKPDDRYQNAEELLYALENYSDDGEMIEPTLPIAPISNKKGAKSSKGKPIASASADDGKDEKKNSDKKKEKNKKPIIIAAASVLAVAVLGGVIVGALSKKGSDEEQKSAITTLLPTGTKPPISTETNNPDVGSGEDPGAAIGLVITNDPIAYSFGPGATQVPTFSNIPNSSLPTALPTDSLIGTPPPSSTNATQIPKSTVVPTAVNSAVPTSLPTTATPKPTAATPKPATPVPVTPKPTTPKPTVTPKPTTPKPTVTPTPTTPKPITPPPTTPPTANPSVHFNSSTFEAALRQKYNLTGTITTQTLLNFTELELKNCGLTDISDVAKFKNITKLILSENNITNISAVSGLTKLKLLKLGRNNISNVSALQNMTWLQKLYLEYNNISNVTYLMRLVGLKTIWLYGNPIPQSQIDALRAALVNCTEFGW